MRGRDGPIRAIRRWFGAEDKPLRSLRYNETYEWGDLPDDAQMDIVELEEEITELRGAVTVLVVIMGLIAAGAYWEWF